MPTKKLSDYFIIACLLGIIYLTIWVNNYYFDLLWEKIENYRKGYVVVQAATFGDTWFNLIIANILKILMIGSAVLLLFRRTVFFGTFFILLFSPLLINIIQVLSPYIGYIGRIEFKSFYISIYRETILLILLIVLFGNIIATRISNKEGSEITRKGALKFLILLIISFFLYYIFRVSW